MPTTKKITDLRMFALESEKEGFCMLHHGQKNPWSTVFQSPIKKHHTLPQSVSKNNFLVGYLAYPNPKLKNEIPDHIFYEFEKAKRIKNTEIKFPSENEKGYWSTGKIETSVNKKAYLKKISEIKQWLEAGEIYQVNYAIRFRKKFEGDPYQFYLRWLQKNPSDFSAYLNCGKYQILSMSPERLFKLKDGVISTEPIKGTAPKSGGKKALEELIKSEKERAELDMITDLARNDVGQVCDYGSLKLKKNREILELSNLWHTYSKVTGKVNKNIGIKEVLDALFPGGSITGCPKKRAMQYIEKLEGLPRNIFTGSIGYLKKTGEKKSDIEADFNIAIRTALIKGGFIEYWAGGGIVMDSDPEKEYEECFLKAEKFLNLL